MRNSERLIVTLPADVWTSVRGAVEAGHYASTDEAIEAALRDWSAKRLGSTTSETDLKAQIETGLADLAAGRVKDFDATRILRRGRALFAGRSPSA